jgi:hypothetical protein
VMSITPPRRHRPLQPARAMSRVTTKVSSRAMIADATAPARVRRRTRRAARIGRRVQAKPRDRATAITRTTDRTTTTGRTQPKAPLTDRRTTDQTMATDQQTATPAGATTDRAAATTADGRLWMNRCTTGGELRKYRGQLTEFCGPQRFRKVLSSKGLRVVPRTARNLPVTDQGGGSGRFRGKKQRESRGQP